MTLFERVGLLYLGRFLNPKWDCAALSRTPRSRQALALFVGSYAYEYQGAPPKFARAAQAVINSGSSTPDPKLVWKAFRSQINGSTNPQHNLLYHEGTSCNCVLCELRQGNKLINIVTRARRRLRQDEVARGIRNSWPSVASGPKSHRSSSAMSRCTMRWRRLQTVICSSLSTSG